MGDLFSLPGVDESLPLCAQTCLYLYIADSDCGLNDIACQCASGLREETETCLNLNCDAEEREEFYEYVEKECGGIFATATTSKKILTEDVNTRLPTHTHPLDLDSVFTPPPSKLQTDAAGTNSPSSNSNSSALTPGAIAGIAIGGAAIIPITLLSIWLLLRHRRRSAAAPSAIAGPMLEGRAYNQPELADTSSTPKAELKGTDQAVEVDVTEVFEMESRSRAEMKG